MKLIKISLYAIAMKNRYKITLRRLFVSFNWKNCTAITKM